MYFTKASKNKNMRSQGGWSASSARSLDMAGGFLSMILERLGLGLEKTARPNQHNYSLSDTYVWKLASPEYPQRRSRGANTSTSITPEHYIYNGFWV